MSSQSKYGPQTSKDFEGDELIEMTEQQEGKTVALSLREIAAKITRSLSNQGGALQDHGSLTTTLQTRHRLESSLQSLTRDCSQAQNQLRELQSQKPESSSDHSSHLRVLKDLARQQQTQLSEHRQWQLRLATLLEKECNSENPLRETPQALLEAVESVLTKKQNLQQDAEQKRELDAEQKLQLDAKQKRELDAEQKQDLDDEQGNEIFTQSADAVAEAKLQLQDALQQRGAALQQREAALQECETALQQREAAEEIARNLAAKCEELQRVSNVANRGDTGGLQPSHDQDLPIYGQTQLPLEQALLESQRQLQELQGELLESQKSVEVLEQRRDQVSGELTRLAQLEDENSALQAALLNQQKELQGVAEELALSRSRQTAQAPAHSARASEQGDDQLRQLCEHQQNQLVKSKALWEQSSKKLLAAQGQLAQVQQERASALHRAGLEQSRLDEQFKLCQRLKKELLLAAESNCADKERLGSTERELQELKKAERDWAGHKLELQRQLVEAAQKHSDARQLVGQLQSAQQQLATSERELSREKGELAAKIDALESQAAESQRSLSALQELSQQQLADLTARAAADKSAALDERSQQVHAQQFKISELERQNTDLHLQLEKVQKAVDEKQKRADQLAKEGGQAHRALQQMVEQLREKEARAHILQCQLHKKTKELVGTAEQLTNANGELLTLRQTLASSQGSEKRARESSKANQELQGQVHQLEQQLQRAQEKLARLEGLEREHAQLKALLLPLKNALQPEQLEEPQQSPPPVQTVDLFEARQKCDKLRAHLFE